MELIPNFSTHNIKKNLKNKKLSKNNIFQKIKNKDKDEINLISNIKTSCPTTITPKESTEFTEFSTDDITCNFVEYSSTQKVKKFQYQKNIDLY